MAGHAALMELGPKLDWTRDHRCYERFPDWKREVQLLFNSALTKASNAEKSSYVQLWMGKESYPIVRKWTAENRLDFTRRVAADGNPISSGFLPETYFTLLEAEFKPKANRIISIIHLWTQVKQGNTELNEWITRIINLVEECGYAEKNRIIRDALIVGTNSDRAKEMMVRKGSNATLEDVLEILQTEYSTDLMVQQYNSETRNVHYLKYDSRKGKGKKKSSSHSTSKNPAEQNSNSTDKKCFRCGGKWFKGHEKDCKAIKAKCHSCGTVGHFDKVCKKKNSNSKKQHVLEDSSTNSAHEFYDDNGHIVQQHMLTWRNKHQKELLIEFGAGSTLDSVDRKLLLKLDTGADVNSINRKTYKRLFSDIELTPLSAILENFDKSLVRPLGTFKCFLRWKGKFYRIDVEVMDQDDSPNVLC